jgi:hypothetical protein
MTNRRHGLARRPPIVGLLLGVAAAAWAATCISVVAVLFQQVLHHPFLTPSPAILAERARCDALAERVAREQCLRAVLQRVLAPDRGDGRFAQR